MHRYGNLIMVVAGSLLLMFAVYFFTIHEIHSAREIRESNKQGGSEIKLSPQIK